MTESLPRRFGPYLLTAHLGEDALGRVYRAIRMSGERTFVRLRILEGPEISEDPVLDAIEENGEIHSFLKNPAIARGVQLDAVEGVPFLAWNEENGRTLDSLLDRSRNAAQPVPYEHALLIAEKIATALDHAYNTTVDGERTLHGLVWPGFVSITDDGETRLTGFGLATGFFSSFSRPRFAQEIAPFLAPEERSSDRIARNSDVYSVGAILFALLMGRPPNTADPVLDLRTVRNEGVGVAPQVAALLRMCLGPEEDRYQSTGDLRRELGKLLFSGPYAPSTFNLAFFLNGLFAADIEAETNARLKEAALEEAQQGDPGRAAPPPAPPVPPASHSAPARAAASGAPPPVRGPGISVPPIATSRDRTPALGTGGGETLPAFGMPPRESRRPPSDPPPPPRSRAPLYTGGTLLVLAAVAGGIFLLLRRSPPPAPAPVPTAIPASPTPAPPPTPAAPTSAMNEAQFKEEVSRRVAQELKKMETEMRRLTPADGAPRRSHPAGATSPSGPPAEPATAPAPTVPAPAAEAPTPVVRAPAALQKEAETEPPAAAPREVFPTPEVEIAPKILRVVKPVYPPMALRARMGGTVLLRVLVGENGAALDVQVISGAPGGLTESAVAAVRKWRFTPGQRGGAPVKSWTTVPIPFEP
jgi:periplasmic protein TonB